MQPEVVNYHFFSDCGTRAPQIAGNSMKSNSQCLVLTILFIVSIVLEPLCECDRSNHWQNNYSWHDIVFIRHTRLVYDVLLKMRSFHQISLAYECPAAVRILERSCGNNKKASIRWQVPLRSDIKGTELPPTTRKAIDCATTLPLRVF